MSDDPTVAAESADAAQSAVETEGSPPPWGDDFNPERAWRTITHLRGREQELESEAKTWKRFREDEEFRREQLSDLGYAVEDEEDDDEDEDDDIEERQEPPHDPRVDMLIQERAAQQFKADLKDVAKDREVSQQAQDWIAFTTHSTGNNRQALEKATKAWFEYEDGLREAALRQRSEKPTPPTPPQPGRAGEAEFDRKNASPAQRKANREARIAAQIAAGEQSA